MTNDGTILGVNMSPDTDSPTGYDLNELKTGEGAQLVVDHVVNYTLDPVHPEPLFRYMSYEGNNLITSTSVEGGGGRAAIRTVVVHLLVDLNPGRSPVQADLETTAQLRNQR